MRKFIPEGTKIWLQEGPGIPHLLYYVGHAGTLELKELSDLSFNLIVTVVKHNFFTYGYDENDIARISKEIIKRQKNDMGFTDALMKKWRVYEKKFYDNCREMDNIDLALLSEDDLKNLFVKFGNDYMMEYTLPLFSDAISIFCEKEIQHVLRNELKNKGLEKKMNHYLTTLTVPTEESFLGRERYELMLIAKDLNDGKEVQKNIEEHAKRWYWIQNNYLRTIVLDKDYFFSRAKKHKFDIGFLKEYKSRAEAAIKQKETIIEELDISENLKLLISIMDKYASWQDLRKKANLIGHHYIMLFLKEISRRKAVENIGHLMFEEIIDILDGKPIDSEIIKQRKKLTAMHFTPKGTILYVGKDAENFYDEVQSHFSSNGVGDLYGTVANMGKIVAKARIIMSPNDFHKMQEGDVIITSMTRPEFIPILKLASAIVTDEGGITCHAAIISRELGVPCIVGTKVATKVIKDGVDIEVNANHGQVRVIGEIE